MPQDDWAPAEDEFGGSAWAPSITGVNLGAPIISGTPTSDLNVVINGRGVPGAVLELSLDGSSIVNAATVDTAGYWSCQLRITLGTHTLRARQSKGGKTSPWSATVTILVESGRVSAWGSAISGRK